MDFNEWKKDLAERLQRHLDTHPESHNEPLLLPNARIPWVHGGKMKVEVQPSPYSEGAWVVKKDGEIEKTFFEPDAWRNASKYASDLINGQIGDKI